MINKEIINFERNMEKKKGLCRKFDTTIDAQIAAVDKS